MLRLTSYFIIAVLTCALGISASALWSRLRSPIYCNGTETEWTPATERVEEDESENIFRNTYPPGVQPHPPAQIAAHGREEIILSKGKKKKARSSR